MIWLPSADRGVHLQPLGFYDVKGVSVAATVSVLPEERYGIAPRWRTLLSLARIGGRTSAVTQ